MVQVDSNSAVQTQDHSDSSLQSQVDITDADDNMVLDDLDIQRVSWALLSLD